MAEALHQGAGLRIAVAPGPRKTLLRYLGTGWAPDDLPVDGLVLPREINRAGPGEPRAMRLGPGEWLAVGWEGPQSGTLPPALIAVDVSDGLACFEVQGPRSRDLLAGGSSVDLDAATFAPGMVTRTRFARATAIVECVAIDRFMLYADRSIGAYMSAWLAHHAPLVEAIG